MDMVGYSIYKQTYHTALQIKTQRDWCHIFSAIMDRDCRQIQSKSSESHMIRTTKSTPNLKNNKMSINDISKCSLNSLKKYSGSDTELTKDMSFPSPPLSPKLHHMDYNKDKINSIDVIINDTNKFNNLLIVKPVWDKNLLVGNYHNRTQKFLSEYNFNNKDSTILVPINRNLRVLQTNGRYVKSDNDWLPRKILHRNARNNHSHSYSHSHHNHNHNHNRISSVSSPIPQSSPLASSMAIGKAPQYIPNMSWEKLPDYSPTVSSLPKDNIKALKVEWKGSSLDLSNDPLRNKLHPAELLLAQILRLPCDLYLDSKRRLFLEKVYRLKKGLPFRRTDAQKACRIDVNKASRLFAAYEKVGWLNDSNFQKFLTS